MPIKREVTLYTLAELKEANPDGFEKALERLATSTLEDALWTDGIAASFRAVFAALGVKLRDWNLTSEVHRCNCRFDLDDNTRELTGRRAFAWFENNLFADLRIPFTGKRRRSVAKFGAFYRPGMVEPCPLTGVCYDEYFLYHIKAGCRAGDSVGDILRGLADCAGRLMEKEEQFRTSEECLMEDAEANEWLFTIDGRHG